MPKASSSGGDFSSKSFSTNKFLGIRPTHRQLETKGGPNCKLRSLLELVDVAGSYMKLTGRPKTSNQLRLEVLRLYQLVDRFWFVQIVALCKIDS